MTETVSHYLTRKGMTIDQNGLPMLQRAFAKDLDSALAGKPSYIRPLPSFLVPPTSLAADKRVLAIDMGGTNLRSAEVYFDKNGRAVMGEIYKSSIAGTAMTATDFLAMLADVVSASACEDVGFCFSYQASILPDRDACIIGLSKELKVDGLKGVVLGREINRILKAKGLATRRFTILNDSTAVFLSACVSADRPADVACSFIIGTGTNSAYAEKGQILNTESGCFAGFPRGSFDLLLDEQSAMPGDHQAEKMIGGKYLMQLTDLCTSAIKEDLAISYDPSDEVRDILYDRAALFVTAELAALLERCGKGKNGSNPAVICFEGSTYRLTDGLKTKIGQNMEAYIRGRLGIEYTLIESEHAGLAGAAAAALAKTVQ